MTYRKRLSTEALNAERQARWARFKRTLGAVDRILSHNCTGLEITPQAHSVPEWTDGETVTMNPSALPDLIDEYGGTKPDSLMVWLGINGHGVGHTMFTPRAGSPLDIKIGNLEANADNGGGLYEGIRKLENLAEDQRMERLVIGRFRPWGTYLTAAAVRLLVEGVVGDASEDRAAAAKAMLLEQAWPLICGRTWMPAEARRAARDAWEQAHGEGSAKRISDLIGSYQRLADPGYEDATEALHILRKLHTELANQGVDVSEMAGGGCKSPRSGSQEDRLSEGDMPDVGEVEDDDVPSAGSEQDEQAMDNAQPQSSDKDSEGDGSEGQGSEGQESEGQESDDGGSGDGGQSEDESASDQGGGQSEGQGSEGQGQGKGDDAQAAGDGQSGGEGGSKAEGQGGASQQAGGGHSNQTAGAKTVADLEGMVRRAAKASVVSDPTVRKDLEDMRKALEGSSKHTSHLPHESQDPHRGASSDSRNRHKHPEHMPVSREARRLANAVSEHMRHLVDETLPYWNRRVEDGKLNVGRYMMRDVGVRLDTIFDRFQQGMQDDVSLDVSICLDVSSSMGWVPSLGPSPKDENGMPTGWKAPIVPAAEATWAIQRAVEAAEGDVTVYGYDRSAYIISPKGRRVKADTVTVPAVGGGTNPTELLQELWERLPTVEARHKLVIAVTDGDWTGGGEVMRNLNERGAITVGVVLDPYLNTIANTGGSPPDEATLTAHQRKRRQMGALKLDKMGVTYGAVMDQPLDMVPLFEQVVTEVMLRAIQGVA